MNSIYISETGLVIFEDGYQIQTSLSPERIQDLYDRYENQMEFEFYLILES